MMSHGMIAELLFAHPLERVFIGVIPPERDLDVIFPRHVPFRDQALDPSTVADHVPKIQTAVVMGVKVNDADIPLTINICHRGNVGIGKRVVAADNKGNDVRTVLFLRPEYQAPMP